MPHKLFSMLFVLGETGVLYSIKILGLVKNYILLAQESCHLDTQDLAACLKLSSEGVAGGRGWEFSHISAFMATSSHSSLCPGNLSSMRDKASTVAQSSSTAGEHSKGHLPCRSASEEERSAASAGFSFQ